jgi:DNA-binding CsgD family transcriptional regulator
LHGGALNMSELAQPVISHVAVIARENLVGAHAPPPAVTPAAAYVGLQMFEHNPTAMLITHGRAVERANAAAAALLEGARPIAVAGGRLRFDDTRVQDAFEALSRAEHQGDARRTFAFVVEGAEGRTFIAQLWLAPRQPHEAGEAVIVALTPFSGASQPREAMLAGFTELTPTERTIFAAFVDGDDIASIAARMDRSVETVRWHVRNLFAKLGVNSQADLVRLGALLLPI